jgi:hypothetical protein
MDDAIMVTGARSDLRLKLLLTLAKNPGKEFTEAELAHTLNTTSSAVAKSLRPIAEGVLKDVLKTYNIFDNRIYKVEDVPLTKQLADNVGSIVSSIEKLDVSLRTVGDISEHFESLKEEYDSGKIDRKEYEKRVALLEEELEASKE